MYYIEQIVDGVLCYRLIPDGPWHEMTKEQLTNKIMKLQQELDSKGVII